jgi:hypothetical protein
MKLITSSSLLLTAICIAAEPASFTVTPELMAPKPISPRLYSNFIELGYGIQVEPMMSQQFYNRSFEPFTPYKTINIEWFDLWNDPQNPSKGYKNDWTGEDWYHTGYEHNPWFVAPGTGGRCRSMKTRHLSFRKIHRSMPASFRKKKAAPAMACSTCA